MDGLLDYICLNAIYAHYICFGLLLLTGLNIPISEDLIILGGGAIAATCIPDHALRLYVWIYFGCIFSAWEAYWIGRLLGPRLYDIRLFKHIITPHRLDLLRHYYAKFGVFTFIVGRFFPGGIRNALFISSGLTKMHFYLFILRDGSACLLSSSILFILGYRFGANFDLILHYFKTYTHWFIALFTILGIAAIAYFWYSHHRKK